MIDIDLTEAEAFNEARMNTEWAVTPAEQRAACYRASDYVEAIYLVNGHEGDDRVKMAVMMLAAEMLTKQLSVAAPKQAILKEEKAFGKGAIDKSITYAAPSSDPYPLITAILAPIPRRVDAAILEASKTPSPTLTSMRLRRA